MDLKYDEKDDFFYGPDINIAIASGITAGARVEMSQYKNNPDYNIYYTDTDSIVIDKPLAVDKVGNNLGQMKLEHTIKKGVFIAPKVYALETIDGEVIIKVKGVSRPVLQTLTYNDLQQLLIKDSIIKVNQEKQYKDLLAGKISVLEVAYQLRSTHNKRLDLYLMVGDNEIFNNTEPYRYQDIEGLPKNIQRGWFKYFSFNLI